PRPPIPPLFPYTTLFRSDWRPFDRIRANGTGMTSLRSRRDHLPRISSSTCLSHFPFVQTVRPEPVEGRRAPRSPLPLLPPAPYRSEEHTSELQSRDNLVC